MPPSNQDKTKKLVAKLRAELAALGDRRDVPNTDRALDEYDRRHNELSITATVIERAVNALKKPEARVAELRDWLTTARMARTALEAEATAAGDWHKLNGHEATRAWRGQEELADALKALSIGVEFIAGRPAVPGRLLPLIGEWHGSIRALEQRLNVAEAELSTRRATLARHLATGARLVADREPAHA